MTRNPNIHLYKDNTNTPCKKKYFLYMAALFVSQIISPTLYAQGVAAGIDISNTAIVNYKINGVSQSELKSAPAVFKVDRKIDLTLTGNTHANANPGDTHVGVSYTLINEGNDSQEFSLIPDTSLVSDTFDPSNCSATVTAITGTPLTGVSTPSTGNIKLKADQQASITVNCDIPTNNSAGQSLQTGDTGQISLYATAEKNIDKSTGVSLDNVVETTGADSVMGVDTVFADDAGPDDTKRDAMHTARRNYYINKSLVAPVASNDLSENNTINTAVTINILSNDTDIDGDATINPQSVVLLGTGVSTDGKTKQVAGEGVWQVNPNTGIVTFTPESGFDGDPSPINYTVKDNDGNTSNPASITVDYTQSESNAALVINKTILSVVDPNGGNKAVTDAIVTYKINVTSSGTGTINNVIITDITPAGMTYKAGSMLLDNTSLTDSNDSDNADFGITDTDTATINLGNIVAGSLNEIILSYTIN